VTITPQLEQSRLQSTFAHMVEQLVRDRTMGLIQGLHVEVFDNELVLNGRTSTYYAKQLATHAALDACDHITLTNDIEVN